MIVRAFAIAALLLAPVLAIAAQADIVAEARQALADGEEQEALSLLAPLLTRCASTREVECAMVRQLEIGAIMRDDRPAEALGKTDAYAADFGLYDPATGLLYASIGAYYLITEEVARAEPLLRKGFDILDATGFDADDARWQDGFLDIPQTYLRGTFEGIAMILATAMYDRGLYPEAERYLRLGVLGEGFDGSYGDDGTAIVIAHLMRLQDRCDKADAILAQLSVEGPERLLLLRERTLCALPVDPARAGTFAREALDIATAFGGQSSGALFLAEAQFAIGAAALAGRDYPTAIAALEEAVRLRGDLPARIGDEGRIAPFSNPALILRLLAEAYEGAGNQAAAYDALDRARAAARRFGGPSLEDRIEGDTALALFLLRRDERLPLARALLRDARTLLDERMLRFRSFDTAAQGTAQRYRKVHTARVAVAWRLAGK